MLRIIGLTPMVRVRVEVGVEHVPPCGLHAPMVTVPPLPENGKSGSALDGTVIVRTMLLELMRLTERLLSATIRPPVTMPTLVCTELPPLATNPVPLTATMKLPLPAVGKDAGERVVICAPGDWTATLLVTLTALPPPLGVRVTMPESGVPGAAAPNTDGRKRTEIGVPKL